MPLRPEVSASEISKLSCDFIVSSPRKLRIKHGGRNVVICITSFVLCLFSVGICADACGQDATPAKQKTESVAGVSEAQLSEADDSSEKDLKSVASKTDVNKNTVAEAASSKAGLREINLLEKGLAESWSYFSSDETSELSDTWALKLVDEQQQLICRGTPKGFLYTKAQYSNFRLSFEWKYITDPDSNSGVLIYTQKEPRLWPTAMQVQLHQPLAGCIFPGGDATSDNTNEAKDFAREIGQWNTCLIVSEGGKLSVEVNGRKAGEVSGCSPSTGFIALQAEGSETHFRKLRLQVLPPPEAKPSVTADATLSEPAAAKKEAQPPKKSEAIKSKSDDEPLTKPVGFDG